MFIYLAAAPDKLDTALRFTDRIAHVAYRIGTDENLEKQPLAASVRGGILALGDGNCGEIRDGDVLCREVLQECTRRGFGSVVADFEQLPSEDKAGFLVKLCTALQRSGRELFVPEGYGCDVPCARVMICTALSGGTLTRRLEEARQRFGDRLALDLQRLRMEFPLPCPGGEGCALDGKDLRAALEEKPAVYFSEDLCAKYFVRPCGCDLRFVLFDDAETLRTKCRLAERMGIKTAFLMYPETEDILPELFAAN